MAGQFMWFDLSAPDTGQAREFYSGLFGWVVAPAESAGPYQAWITDGQQPWAGIVQAGSAGSGWLPYVVVGASVTIADPGGVRLAPFKPHAGQG